MGSQRVNPKQNGEDMDFKVEKVPNQNTKNISYKLWVYENVIKLTENDNVSILTSISVTLVPFL